MTLEEIAEARRVIAQASSPPWRRSEQGIECGTGSVREVAPNLTFIIAARTGWPAALDEVEWLQTYAAQALRDPTPGEVEAAYQAFLAHPAAYTVTSPHGSSTTSRDVIATAIRAFLEGRRRG